MSGRMVKLAMNNYPIQLSSWMNSLEFQAAFACFDKNKRKHNLSKEVLQILAEESLKLSEERKQSGKTPNLDYLIQKLGEKFKNKG